MNVRCKNVLCKQWHCLIASKMLAVFVFSLFFVREAAALESDVPAAIAPTSRIGQLSLVSNSVRMRVERASAWEQAVLNTPMATGSAIATQIPGRTEIRIGSTAIRLGQESQAVMTEISDARLHIDLVNGLFALRVRALAPSETVLLKAGNVSLHVLKPGSYRFKHLPHRGRLQVWVLEGQARANLSEQNFMLDAGQQMQWDRGIASQLTASASEDNASFDAFIDGRDRRSETSLSLMHVSPELSAAQDLDGHGDWRDQSGYGAIWFPSKLPADWAPYRFGRWRWLAPWGWTWIDDAPWGFAPFHYGRWLFTGGRWGWVPGQLADVNAQTRPIYAPALVGFFSIQGGTSPSSAATSTPLVGWYPLAPGEVYWPAANAVAQPHRYARTAFAATVMPYSAFSTMQEVANNQIVMSPAELAKVPLILRRLPPPPTTAPLPAQAK
jgi:hypothetical protein